MIAFFGGSFDPLHLGHLHLAEQAVHILGVSKVYFVPAAQNPLKPKGANAPAQARFEMVQRALEENANPAFVVSDVEVRRPGPSFTVDSLAALQQKEKGEWVLLVGNEVFEEFPRWKDPARLCSLANIAVVKRTTDGDSIDQVVQELGISSPKKWIRSFAFEILPFSATALRQTLRGLPSAKRHSEESPVAGLQRSVWQFIKENQLYTVE